MKLRISKFTMHMICWGFICIGAALCGYGAMQFFIETNVQQPVVHDWSMNPENGVSGIEIDTNDNPSYPETGNGDAAGGQSDSDDTNMQVDQEGNDEEE